MNNDGDDDDFTGNDQIEKDALYKQLRLKIVDPLKYLIEDENNGDPMSAFVHFIERCNIWEMRGKNIQYYCPGLEDADGNTLKFEIKDINIALKEFRVRYSSLLKTQDATYSYFRRALKFLDRFSERSVGFVSEEDETSGKKKVNFNLVNVSTKNWVKPKIEYGRKSHPIFDILLKSLSGGAHDVQEHLERCILQKRFFPMDYRVPTIAWKDPGGTGKTLFVNSLLKTIFGGSVHVGSAKWIYKTASNAAIMGKVVVLADDSTIPEGDYDDVKRMLHNPLIEIREQKGNPFYVTNVGWFIISGNMRTPSVPVDGGEADRRFSIIELGYDVLTSKDFNYHIMKQLKISRKAADAYRLENVKLFENREEVAIWLGDLVLRRGIPKSEGSLTAYHDEFYIEKVKGNRDEFALTFDLVFLSDYFTRIEAASLRHLHYNILNPGRKYKLLEPGTFGTKVSQYLKHHELLNTKWEHKPTNGKIMFYRLNDDGGRIELTCPTLQLETLPATDVQKWEHIINTLYQDVNEAYDNKMPPPDYNAEKNVWTDSEILDVLNVELGVEVVNGWSNEEAEEQVFQFVESVQEDRYLNVAKATLSSREVQNDYYDDEGREQIICEVKLNGSWVETQREQYPFKRHIDGEPLLIERRFVLRHDN